MTFPHLHTTRLILRQPVENDAIAVFGLRSDPAVTRHTGVCHGEPEQSRRYIARLAQSYAAGEDIFWAIALQEDSTAMIGGICLWNRQPSGSFYLGYELLPVHWGKGYMGEALAAVQVYAASPEARARYGPIPKLLADPREENVPSSRLLEKQGFERVSKSMGLDGAGEQHRHFLFEKCL